MLGFSELLEAAPGFIGTVYIIWPGPTPNATPCKRNPSDEYGQTDRQKELRRCNNQTCRVWRLSAAGPYNHGAVRNSVK